MSVITLTVSTINGVAPSNSLQALETSRIISFTGAGNATSGAATLKVMGMQGTGSGAINTQETWVVTETYAVVKAAIIAANQPSAIGAKIPSGALVAGVRTITDANVTTSSVATIAKRALGGTYAPGYKVVCTASTVTITALQSDGTTTETANTDSVMGYIVY